MTDQEFQEAMAALPEPPKDSVPPHWDHWRHDLWERAQVEPPEGFTSWPCVYHTMLCDHFDMTAPIAYLDGDTRWIEATRSPDRSIHLALVEQAHHLKRWEDTTGKRVEDLDRILEFGGGFGACALVVRRLGFAGDYAIYDLPEFALLQKWYLDKQGISVRRGERTGARADLLIAAYSISETPIVFRDEFMSEIEAGSYLFLYSPQFADYNNVAYFAEFTRQKPIKWSIQQFPGRPDWYAIA